MSSFKLKVLIFLSVLFAISPLYAQTGQEREKDIKRYREIFYKELGLSPEQQQRMEENRKNQREEKQRVFEAIKEKRAQLQKRLKEPDISIEKVQPLVNEIKSLQGQLIDFRIKGILSAKETLTEEQFEKLQEMAERRLQKRKKAVNKFKNTKSCCKANR